MADSDFVFEQGEAINAGQHGESDYMFASGDPVPNNGVSEFVYQSGTGLRGTEGLTGDIVHLELEGDLINQADATDDGEIVRPFSTYYEPEFVEGGSPFTGNDYALKKDSRTYITVGHQELPRNMTIQVDLRLDEETYGNEPVYTLFNIESSGGTVDQFASYVGGSADESPQLRNAFYGGSGHNALYTADLHDVRDWQWLQVRYVFDDEAEKVSMWFTHPTDFNQTLVRDDHYDGGLPSWSESYQLMGLARDQSTDLFYWDRMIWASGAHYYGENPYE